MTRRVAARARDGGNDVAARRGLSGRAVLRHHVDVRFGGDLRLGCRLTKDIRKGALTTVAYGDCATSTDKGVAAVSIEGFGHGWTRQGFGYEATVEIRDFLARQVSPHDAGRR